MRVDLPQLRTIVSDGFSFMYVSSAVFKSGKLKDVLTIDMPKTENAVLDKGFRLVGKACQYWGNVSDDLLLCRCGEDGCLFPQHRGIESCLVCSVIMVVFLFLCFYSPSDCDILFLTLPHSRTTPSFK